MRLDDRTLALTLLGVMRAVRSVSAGIIFVVFPYIAKELLGLSLFQLVVIYAAAGAATAALSVVVGYMTDLIGRKASLAISSLLLVLTPLMLLVRVSYITAVIAAILGGISATGAMGAGGVGGVVGPVQSTIIADLSEGLQRTRLLSLMFFVSTITAAAGTLIGGYLNYRDELVLAMAIAVASMALLPFMRLPRVRASKALMSPRAISNAFKFSVTGMLNGLSSGLVTPFIIPIFVYVYRAPRPLVSDVTTVASLIATFSMLAAPYLEQRLGFIRSITITRGITIPIMLAFPFVGSFWAAAALFLAYPAFRVIAIPSQQSLMLELTSPEERGRVSGFNQGSRLALSSAATAAATPAFDTSTLGLLWAPFAMYAVVMALNIYLYWRFFSGEEARRRVPRAGEAGLGLEA